MSLFDAFYVPRRIAVSGTDIHVLIGERPGKPVLLLLHGYPQTHAIWHRLAPLLAAEFSLVIPDLRGYGDSGKPASLPDASNQSKRAMAQDMVELMSVLGHDQFHVAGHDRGGRVVHRMCLDHEARVASACMPRSRCSKAVWSDGDRPGGPAGAVLYATLEGVGSARGLSRLTESQDAYRWLCGGVQVNHHTLSDFRVEHGEALNELLSVSVASLMAAGVVKLKHVAQDASERQQS